MCHFVTMTVSDSVDTDGLREQLRRHGREFSELNAASLRPAVRADEHYFLAGNPAGCDCGTALGSYRKMPATELSESRKEAAKISSMRRKGWSDAKIARALGSADAADRYKQELEEAEGRGPGEIENWASLIEGLQGVARSGPVGILLHFYDGALTDAFEIGRDNLAPRDLKEFLGMMEEDVLYQLTPPTTRGFSERGVAG